MNNTTLVGRITKDAEVKALEKNNLISFTIAVPRKLNKDKSRFININVFRKEDKLSQYLTKGTQIAVSGELQVDNVQSNGAWKTFVKVVADELTLLGKRESKEDILKQVESLGIPFADDEEPINMGDYTLNYH